MCRQRNRVEQSHADVVHGCVVNLSQSRLVRRIPLPPNWSLDDYQVLNCIARENSSDHDGHEAFSDQIKVYIFSTHACMWNNSKNNSPYVKRMWNSDRKWNNCFTYVCEKILRFNLVRFFARKISSAKSRPRTDRPAFLWNCVFSTWVDDVGKWRFPSP